MEPVVTNQKNKTGWWLLVIVTVLGINFLASVVHERMDLTDEKRFTISSPVKKILSGLDGDVQVDVFLKGDMPSGFKKLSASAGELLEEFKDYAKGRIHYRVLSADDAMPGSSRTYADTLSSLGVIPINLKVQLKAGEASQFVYPAALVHYRDSLLPVNLYSGTQKFITDAELNSAEALLEYKFADAINRLAQKQRPMVAYSVGNGEPTGDNVYDLVENVLRKNYGLFTFNIAREPVIPDTFKLLLIVKPTVPFTNSEKLKIDQYLMRGGKIIWLIDRLEAEMDSLRIKNQVIAYDRNLNIEDLLFKYGVRINPDLIMDLQCDFLPFVNARDSFDYLHWNYFPLFESKQNSLVNKHVGLVAGRFVNSVDTIDMPGIKKTFLLSSSPNSRTIEAPALISGEENRNAPEDEAFKKKDIPAAVLLEGRFTSLYKNRMSQDLLDSLAHYNTPYISQCLNDNKMIVIGDGDIVLNSISKEQPLPMGVNAYTIGTQYQYQFANREFIENCLEYLINDAGLSEARAKDYTLRLLDPKKITAERAGWQMMNLALPVLLILIGGIIYQWWRRKRYSSRF
jgi:ABC-2 type transport system permease protein